MIDDDDDDDADGVDDEDEDEVPLHECSEEERLVWEDLIRRLEIREKTGKWERSKLKYPVGKPRVEKAKKKRRATGPSSPKLEMCETQVGDVSRANEKSSTSNGEVSRG